MNNENKQYIDQLSQEYLKGFGSEPTSQAAQPGKIEPGKTQPLPNAVNSVSSSDPDNAIGKQAQADSNRSIPATAPANRSAWQSFWQFLKRLFRWQ